MLMKQEMIDHLVHEKYILEGKATLPKGETVSTLGTTEAVVFKDFFISSLRVPTARFLYEVLECINLQIHHLTPNGLLAMSKFC